MSRERCVLRTKRATYEPCVILSESQMGLTVEYTGIAYTDRGPIRRKKVESVPWSDILRVRYLN